MTNRRIIHNKCTSIRGLSLLVAFSIWTTLHKSGWLRNRVCWITIIKLNVKFENLIGLVNCCCSRWFIRKKCEFSKYLHFWKMWFTNCRDKRINYGCFVSKWNCIIRRKELIVLIFNYSTVLFLLVFFNVADWLLFNVALSSRKIT